MLPRLIGLPRAMEWLLSARTMLAEERAKLFDTLEEAREAAQRHYAAEREALSVHLRRVEAERDALIGSKLWRATDPLRRVRDAIVKSSKP